jgi:hypothetical protein
MVSRCALKRADDGLVAQAETRPRCLVNFLEVFCFESHAIAFPSGQLLLLLLCLTTARHPVPFANKPARLGLVINLLDTSQTLSFRATSGCSPYWTLKAPAQLRFPSDTSRTALSWCTRGAPNTT